MDPRGVKAYILARLKRELDPARTYHSFHHTIDVYASAITIAELEGVTGDDLELLKTAALFHDSGFLLDDLDHEAASCTLVGQVLPGYGFSEEQVTRIRSMIMATRLPQGPEDHLARILCDADLDYLGRDDFRLIGDTLFQELVAFGQLRTEREWNELQVRFISAHRYFTRTNQDQREAKKQENLLEVKRWLERDP